ncbi:cell division topological specificity factor MinE [Candidatus Formimonas warabiya]|uniref:Cell division topological specificity factor n=1 Tax=Formimonas warabiya TaxID=1761012 RepID=A0A3G1KSR2_FORW1|nr:cell division topological specificity factor MinE [Candidatus Formimonas warabiya]ATW25491.1 cell division topological specificity factor MinE [Candidatus Formimonas warabiya]
MNLGDFLNRFFGRENGNSKNVAKERLRLVLVHDRANVSPQIVEALKEELITVINKYLEIDQTALEVSLNAADDSVALVANIPILGIRRQMS